MHSASDQIWLVSFSLWNVSDLYSFLCFCRSWCLAFLILVSEIIGLPWTGSYYPKQNLTSNIKAVPPPNPRLVSFPSSVPVPCNFYPVSLLVSIFSWPRLSVAVCLVLMFAFMKGDLHHLVIWPCELVLYLEILILVFRTELPLRIPLPLLTIVSVWSSGYKVAASTTHYWLYKSLLVRVLTLNSTVGLLAPLPPLPGSLMYHTLAFIDPIVNLNYFILLDPCHNKY